MKRAMLLASVAAWAALGGGTTRPGAPAGRPFDAAALRSRNVFIIPIHEEMGVASAYFVKRSLARARRENAGVVLFDINTPGGRLDVLLDMFTEIGRYRDIPTVAYVNTRAGSAGALLLAGIQHIYMAETAVAGAAALIMASPQGGTVEIPARELEKYNSYVKAEVRAQAKHNGHPFALFHAMIDQKAEVQEVIVDGRREILTREDIDNLYARRDRGEVKEWQKGEMISRENELLTLDSEEALRWGLSEGTFPTREALLKHLGLEEARVTESTSTWSEHLSRFLTHPVVVLILMVVGSIGIYVELNTPGFGAPGIVGIAAFAILFLGQYAAGLAGVLEPILFLVGLVLLGIELFVTPGFGILGASGIVLMLVSIVLAGQDFILPKGELQAEVFLRNLSTVFGGLLISVVLMVILARFLPRTRVFGRIALAPPAAALVRASAVVATAAVGERGRAVSPLRPAGKARFGDRFLDVLTDGQFVEAGAAVEVLRVDGNRIVVTPVSDVKEKPA